MARCPSHDWYETGALGWGRDPARPVLRCANCKKKRGMTAHEYELCCEGYSWKVMGATVTPQTEAGIKAHAEQAGEDFQEFVSLIESKIRESTRA